MSSLELDVPPLCLATNKDGSKLAVGCVDGSVILYDTKGDEFEELWTFKTKTSVRGVAIDENLGRVYAITKNRALCVFDIATGKRTRCILKCHKSPPTAIRILPPSALKNQQLATADESGEVKTWNLTDGVDEPVVRTWNEQEEYINHLELDMKSNLIAASSDATIGAYDLRKGKFKVKSEMMHSEMLSICATQKYVYAGGEDGHVEVFNTTEYGNILERIESGFNVCGVNGIVELRSGLLLLTSQGSNKMRLLNVQPSKRLGIMACHGDEKADDDGIDAVVLSEDRTTLFTAVSMMASIRKWDMPPIVDRIPILRAQDAKTKKKKNDEGGFFADLVDKDEDDSDDDEPKSKKRRADDSDSDSELDEEEEEGEDEENEEEEEDSD